MLIFKSLIVAFSMYTKIPMPQFKWEDKSMKYAICFFPLVGAVIGGVLIFWQYLATRLELNNLIFAAVATYIPILITGGIHVDGFCDTTDALASYQSTEKKLEILKDPNCGAFALIKTVMYFIISFALYTEIDIYGVYIMAVGFVFERALSGISIMHFAKANGSGLAHTFAKSSSKNISTLVLSIITVFSVVALLYINISMAVLAVTFAIISFFYYRHIAYKHFGGVTGDIAGYFLQICELAILATTIISKVVL